MDIQQTATELQKFADANGLQMDVSTVLDSMDAGDFVALNQAMDNSDNHSILKILQKYKSRTFESYQYFSGMLLTEDESINLVNDMTPDELIEHYRTMEGMIHEVDHLTLQEIRTLVYEDLTTQLRANQIVDRNTTTQQQQVNPQTQAKVKQANIQRNANNSSFKVSVPGNQQGTQEIEPVVGIDPGPTPQQTLVVTKDQNKPNELSVYGLDDVETVQNQGTTTISEELSPQEANDEVMGPPSGRDNIGGGPTTFTNTAAGMGAIRQAIDDAVSSEVENTDGEQSPLGNDATEAGNDMIDQIIDFCTRMRGR
ncbi:structural protein [Salmonella phage SE_PL]|nr:structural protein [Salmonella phage 7t3]QIG62719.1 structural protein [Salmonella phage SE_PL]